MGGMPEAVYAFREEGTLLEVTPVHRAIAETYQDDICTLIKNPPPEGVVLSLPLKGDENASSPKRGRGVVPGFI